MSNDLRNKPGAIFGRVSGIEIHDRDFRGSKVIRTMSNGSRFEYTVINANPNTQGNQSKIVRPPQDRTAVHEVVAEVLKTTHRDLGENVVESLVAFIEHSSGIYVPDHTASLSLEIMDADLMRGMDAFEIATTDTHLDIFNPTVVEPARMFAGWLITAEAHS